MKRLQVLREDGKALNQSRLCGLPLGRYGPGMVLTSISHQGKEHPEEFLQASRVISSQRLRRLQRFAEECTTGCWAHYPRNMVIRENH